MAILRPRPKALSHQRYNQHEAYSRPHNPAFHGGETRPGCAKLVFAVPAELSSELSTIRPPLLLQHEPRGGAAALLQQDLATGREFGQGHLIRMSHGEQLKTLVPLHLVVTA